MLNGRLEWAVFHVCLQALYSAAAYIDVSAYSKEHRAFGWLTAILDQLFVLPLPSLVLLSPSCDPGTTMLVCRSLSWLRMVTLVRT